MVAIFFNPAVSHSQSCECVFFFSSRRRHTRCSRDWSSDVCSSDLEQRSRGEAGLRAEAEEGAGAEGKSIRGGGGGGGDRKSVV